MKSLKVLIPSIAIIAGCSASEANTTPPAKEVVTQASKLHHLIKIAVIDTGIADSLRYSPMICETGSKDFTDTGLTDHHGHGTHIAGLIDQYAKNKFLGYGVYPKTIANMKANFCIVVLKYYDPTKPYNNNLESMKKAIRAAIDEKVDFINISGGGTDSSSEEKALVEEALNKGITLVFAAGNEKSDIDQAGKHYYPAYYDKRIVVVGNKEESGKRAPTSNYGSTVKVWEFGTNARSYSSAEGQAFMTGTSQATAIKTGKMVRELLGNQ
jgi:subtilisin family serine protease